MKITLQQDGQRWIAKFGDAVGYGDSPDRACADFDARWYTSVEARTASPVISYTDFLLQ